MTGGPAVFDYALFHGSSSRRLDITGVSVDVTGHAHSNHDFRIRGATVAVTGRLEAARAYDARGSTVTAGSIDDWVPAVPMPEYDVNELRAMCATRYTGNQHWSGQVINLNGGVFIDGDLRLSGVTLQGRGLLIVNGNVHFAGTTFTYSGPHDAVCLYSLGNVRVTGVTFTADGIVYAPNGTFEAHGTTVNVNGSVIADRIDLAGMTLRITHDADAKTLFPGGSTRLTR